MSTIIRLAADFAHQAHASIDQRRKYSNAPYIVHPEAVAKIVESVTDDVEMICAAWLHDVVEDTPVSLGEIESLFGRNIASLVDDLTNVSRKTDGNRSTRVSIDREHTKRSSVRAKTIKLADVIDNLSGITEVDIGFAKRYVQENELLLSVLKDGDTLLYRRAFGLVKECKVQLNSPPGR